MDVRIFYSECYHYVPLSGQAAFKVFETDNVPPGCVSTEVLEHALTTYGSDKLSPDEAAELLATVDPENTGKINYMEFINMMSTN